MIGRTAVLGLEGLRTGEAEDELSAPVLGARNRILNVSDRNLSMKWELDVRKELGRCCERKELADLERRWT